jgi:hypothetical protein
MTTSRIYCTSRKMIQKYTNIGRLCHVEAELDVFAHQVHVEGVVVLAPEDVGSGCLPKEGISGRASDRVPEQVQVHSGLLS